VLKGPALQRNSSQARHNSGGGILNVMPISALDALDGT
jgi:hypothetical protein